METMFTEFSEKKKEKKNRLKRRRVDPSRIGSLRSLRNRREADFYGGNSVHTRTAPPAYGRKHGIFSIIFCAHTAIVRAHNARAPVKRKRERRVEYAVLTRGRDILFYAFLPLRIPAKDPTTTAIDQRPKTRIYSHSDDRLHTRMKR